MLNAKCVGRTGWATSRVVQRNSAAAFPGWQFNALHAYYRVRACFRYSIKLRGRGTASWEGGEAGNRNPSEGRNSIQERELTAFVRHGATENAPSPSRATVRCFSRIALQV